MESNPVRKAWERGVIQKIRKGQAVKKHETIKRRKRRKNQVVLVWPNHVLIREASCRCETSRGLMPLCRRKKRKKTGPKTSWGIWEVKAGEEESCRKRRGLDHTPKKRQSALLELQRKKS